MRFRGGARLGIIMFIILPYGRCLLIGGMGTGMLSANETKTGNAQPWRRGNSPRRTLKCLMQGEHSQYWAFLLRRLLSGNISSHERGGVLQ